MNRHPGLYRPIYLTREGRKKLKEFVAEHPRLTLSEATKRFKKLHPALFKRSDVWWMTFVCAGCKAHPLNGRHRESTGKTTITDAQRELDRLRGPIADGKIITDVNEIKMQDLLNGVLEYARVHCKESTFHEYEDKIRKHLLPFFASYRAVDICLNEQIITRFLGEKKDKGYAKATINGMLNALGLAFSLAKNRLPMSPNIDKHRFKNLNNARKGYYTEPEYELLCRHLPDDVMRPIQTLYITGWRLMEILSRERRHADHRRGVLILEPGEAKNKEPRIFPFSSELRSILEEQEEATRKLERERGVFIPFLFHHNSEPFARYYEKRGYWKPTRYFLNTWKKAASAAGLAGRIRHDFRRTAVRRFDCIPDHVGMKLSGHKSSSVYMAYKATNEKDLFEAVRKIESASSHETYSRSKRKQNY